MGVQQVSSTQLDRIDRALFDDALNFVRRADIDDVLAAMVPGLSARQRAAVAAHTTLAHAAVLVFPVSIGGLIAELRGMGLVVGEAVPSVVVRERLGRRYGLGVDALDVTIVHARAGADDIDSPMVELFALPAGAETARIATRERVEGNESHVALQLDTADEVIAGGLCTLLVEHGGLMPDGDGYNSFEDCTVRYFRSPRSNGSIPYRRLELRVRGQVAAPTVAPDPATRLLELMTGAWTTQAIAVAAEMGVADRLPGPHTPGAPVSIGMLADQLAVAPDGLGRLLRYLASIGLVAVTGDTYALTEPGELLRQDARQSLRPLALLYGGPFYESFGALGHSVRTGRDGFEWHFGRGHFDYFAEHPALGKLFDAAMAASAPMFEPIPNLIDLTAARVVVDVGGGAGELLGRILTHAPHLRGVLLERASVLKHARERLAAAGCGDRCEFVTGDFTRSVPAGGDLYLLSRVLHDWDDERCLTILRACAAAIDPGVALLLVERLLPADATPSLAVAWDLHMLCNVGGRERTAEHYERLLDAAGFDLISISTLPLDGSLLQARRRATIPA